MNTYKKYSFEKIFHQQMSLVNVSVLNDWTISPRPTLPTSAGRDSVLM